MYNGRHRALLLTIVLTGRLASSQTPFFSNVAPAVGFIHTHDPIGDCFPPLGTGSAWADYDNDGDIDLYVTNHGGPNRLYENQGVPAPRFIDRAPIFGVDLSFYNSNGVVFVDYDNDADQDLFVLNLEGNVFFKNLLTESGLVEFIDVTAAAGLSDSGRAITSCWGDYDRDGFLDVYVTKHKKCYRDPQNIDHLYRNLGDGTFEDVSSLLCNGEPVCPQIEALGFSAAWIDYDNDGDPDLYLVNDILSQLQDWHHNVLWRNDGADGNGGWTFTDVSESTGAGIATHSMGLGVSDYDNDGRWDFAVSNTSTKHLLHQMPDGTFTDVAKTSGLALPRVDTWGTVFFDWNNDRWEDLFFAAGSITPDSVQQPNALYENQRDGSFLDISVEAGIDDPGHARNASIVDIDHDGFVDLMVTNLHELPLMYRNNARALGNSNHWLTITAEGTVSNRDAIGTRLIVRTNDSLSMMREITSGPTLGGGDYRAGFFGLAEFTEGNLTVRWPLGGIQEIGRVRADQQLHLREPWPASVNVEIDQLFDPVPDSGGTLPVEFQLTNHSSEPVQTEIWFVLRIPGENTRLLFGPRIFTIPPLATTGKTRSFNIRGDLPEGEYHVIAAIGTYPDTVSAVDSVWFTKGGIGFQTRLGTAGGSLGENYPNPFNATTRITYSVGGLQPVVLKVFDILGREVATLVDRTESAGHYTVEWNATGQPSGIYLYRLEVGTHTGIRKMLLLR